MCEKTFLDREFVLRCQQFVERVFEIIQSAICRREDPGENGGHGATFARFGDGAAETYVIRTLATREELVRRYRGEFGLQMLTENQPGDVLELIDQRALDPFGDMDAVDKNERIVVYTAIVHWTFMACGQMVAPDMRTCTLRCNEVTPSRELAAAAVMTACHRHWRNTTATTM